MDIGATIVAIIAAVFLFVFAMIALILGIGSEDPRDGEG